MVAAKIMFTHVQTIGIIASVDMEFPVAMGQFFGGASVGASAATSGIALECSLDDSTDPVGQTLLTYAVLPGLLSYACVMWTLEVLISYIIAFLKRPRDRARARCCPSCIRLATCRRSPEWDEHVEKAIWIVDTIRSET